MFFGTWSVIEPKLKDKINEIFNGYDLSKLSKYEIRKTIFNHLCRTLNYDFHLLNRIKINNLARESGGNINPLVREPYKELECVIDNNYGICNAIAQYYKLLLEQVGIKSYCVVCDDGTEVRHQLNIVYDEDNHTYSFDDITSEIVGRGPINTFFDYDLEKANSLNQGNKIIFDDYKWIVLEEEYINILVGRNDSPYITLKELPPIKSVKSNMTK